MSVATQPLRVAPVVAFVRSLPGDYYMLSEVSLLLGVNPRVLRNINSDQETFKTLGPSYITNFGKVQVYLYTKADVAKLKKWRQDRLTVLPATKKIASGRPRKWTNEERKHRAKLYSRLHYYRSQIKGVEVRQPKDVARRVKEYQRLIKVTEKELKTHERSVLG